MRRIRRRPATISISPYLISTLPAWTLEATTKPRHLKKRDLLSDARMNVEGSNLPRDLPLSQANDDRASRRASAQDLAPLSERPEDESTIAMSTSRACVWPDGGAQVAKPAQSDVPEMPSAERKRLNCSRAHDHSSPWPMARCQKIDDPCPPRNPGSRPKPPEPSSDTVYAPSHWRECRRGGNGGGHHRPAACPRGRFPRLHPHLVRSTVQAAT